MRKISNFKKKTFGTFIINAFYRSNSKLTAEKVFFSKKSLILANLGHCKKCFLNLATKFRHVCQNCSLPSQWNILRNFCFLEKNDLFVILHFRRKTSIYIAQW